MREPFFSEDQLHGVLQDFLVFFTLRMSLILA